MEWLGCFGIVGFGISIFCLYALVGVHDRRLKRLEDTLDDHGIYSRKEN